MEFFFLLFLFFLKEALDEGRVAMPSFLPFPFFSFRMGWFDNWDGGGVEEG